jgi:preprotein translocase subunit SecA
MTKKKVTPSKSEKAKAGAVANPVPVEDVAHAPAAPKSGTASSPMSGRAPFKRPPSSLNFAGVGRNDICPCGSGKRFKNCHGR